MTEKREMKLHVGSATIVTVFAVLCMTIFAVLTLLSANSEKKLAQATADATAAYYAAEARAYETLAAVAAIQPREPEAFRELLPHTVVSEARDGAVVMTWAEPVDEKRLLSVRAVMRGGAVTVEALRATDAGAWSPDTDIKLWDGE